MAKDAKVKTSEEKTNKQTAVPTADTAVKTAEAKTTEVKKEEPKAEPKKEVKKEEPKKETAAPVKKAAAKPKKAAVKEPMVPELFVQYDDPAGAQEAKLDDIVARVKAAYVAEGHRESSIKSLKIYLKPQEWKAYYVINNKIEGQINLF